MSEKAPEYHAENIHCPECGRLIYDRRAQAIKSVSIILLGELPRGKCKLCKTWVKLPIKLAS